MTSRSLLAAAVLLPVLVLAGCGNDAKEPSAAASPVESPAKSPAASPAARIKVSAALPAGFPKDEIPLLDATVAAASAGDAGSAYAWSVVMLPTGEADDIADDAGDLLDDAGYEAGAKTDAGRLQARQFSNDKYTVGLTVVATEDGNSLTYVVAKK